MKKALIAGIRGQDGPYLAEFLIDRGYQVHGIEQPASLIDADRSDHLYQDLRDSSPKLILHCGDLTDAANVIRVVEEIRPDEIYNLAAQSHVAASFEQPEHSVNVDALGTLGLLEAIRIANLQDKTRFYLASTSELYGIFQEIHQSENSPCYARSPYAIAKLYAYWMTVNYREAYGMYACNGILFNHESPVRSETFVTRDITRALARIKLGYQARLYLGHLNELRNWGHARDFVEMQWLMLQQERPRDFVIATGQHHSVREFVEIAANVAGITIMWRGTGEDEKGYDQDGQCIVEIDSRYCRPTEVDTLLGDPSDAREMLAWAPRVTFHELVKEMMEADLKAAEREEQVKRNGSSTYQYNN
jgi:GDPmannose 4,6-dehydratase